MRDQVRNGLTYQRFVSGTRCSYSDSFQRPHAVRAPCVLRVLPFSFSKVLPVFVFSSSLLPSSFTSKRRARASQRGVEQIPHGVRAPYELLLLSLLPSYEFLFLGSTSLSLFFFFFFFFFFHLETARESFPTR